MARSKKAKKRTSTALLLVLIALAVFIGIELIQVNQRLGEAKVQEASLTRQMQQQQQENEALHIGKLSLDGGELHVDGRIDAVTYEDAPEAGGGGFFARLFG